MLRVLTLIPEKYDPNYLFDIFGEKMQVKDDTELSRLLQVSPSTIGKIRQRAQPIAGSMLARMHEVSGIDIEELRELMGERRTRRRLSPTQKGARQ